MEPTRKIEKVAMRNLHVEDYDQLAKSFKRISRLRCILDKRTD